MTKFLYIADTHLGSDPLGYQQQKGYPERLPEILSALREYIQGNDGVSLILHGGDMIDSTTPDNIVAAAHAFDLPVPVYLCLGNHDLTTSDAVKQWMALAPQFFISGKPSYTIKTPDCVVHVIPNHWCEQPFYWKDMQEPNLSPAQKNQLSHELNVRPDAPHILLTHSPVYGLPADQTGLSEPYHSPNPAFTSDIAAFVQAHSGLKCILGAHNHMNMCIEHEGSEFVTVSSLVETPFEFKLFEVTPEQIRMTTVSLRDKLRFDNVYDAARTFTQGREVDRAFTRPVTAGRESHEG